MPDRDEKGRFLVGCKPGPGRQSGYDPSMDDQAYRLALIGLTDAQIAEFFGIHVDTFYEWKKEHIGFSDAVNRGKLIADGNVAHGLYQRAVGMEVFEERLAHKPGGGGQQITRVRKQIPPDPGAAVNWLSNRQRALWGKMDGVPVDPDDPNAIPDVRNLSDEELAERRAQLAARRAAEKE